MHVNQGKRNAWRWLGRSIAIMAALVAFGILIVFGAVIFP
jgi:disulfide bond formation protein DsbB